MKKRILGKILKSGHANKIYFKNNLLKIKELRGKHYDTFLVMHLIVLPSTEKYI